MPTPPTKIRRVRGRKAVVNDLQIKHMALRVPLNRIQFCTKKAGPTPPISKVRRKPSGKKAKASRTLEKNARKSGNHPTTIPGKKRTALPPLAKRKSEEWRGLGRAIGGFSDLFTPFVRSNADPSWRGPRRPSRKEERERDLGETKRACESPGGKQQAPPQTKRLLGPCGQKQTLEAKKKPNRRGSYSPSAREGQSTPYSRSGKGSGRDHPRAGLPVTRRKAH